MVCSDKEWTAKTFAAALSVDVEVARGVLRFLLAKGWAEAAGTRPSLKGKGENVYKLHTGISSLMLGAFGSLG